MVPSFGARLRAERERKEVSLTTIAEDTKIKISLLEGLEHDDLSWWPGGLFRRAYVRAYARAIGLDPERVVAEFLERYPEPVEADPADTPIPGRLLLTSPITAVSALLRRSSRSEPVSAPIVAAATVDPYPPLVAEETAETILEMVEEVTETEERIEERAEEPAARPQLDFVAISGLCTRLARLSDTRGLRALLAEASRMLDAVGVIVWSWDPVASTLRASLADGYSDALIAQLPTVPADAANAVAAAFRSRETCVVRGGEGMTGALAAPLLGPSGCVGVLAIEVQNGGEQEDTVRAFAAILAAQLAGLVGTVVLAEAVA